MSRWVAFVSGVQHLCPWSFDFESTLTLNEFKVRSVVGSYDGRHLFIPFSEYIRCSKNKIDFEKGKISIINKFKNVESN